MPGLRFCALSPPGKYKAERKPGAVYLETSTPGRTGRLTHKKARPWGAVQVDMEGNRRWILIPKSGGGCVNTLRAQSDAAYLYVVYWRKRSAGTSTKKQSLGPLKPFCTVPSLHGERGPPERWLLEMLSSLVFFLRTKIYNLY